ncbi:MAG: FAD-dependent oxidoreductase [Gemmatimonadetes bacterium]|nr:FAD-dependent oxidoreductase [Gemmatimonadota bacterium]
MSESAKSDLPHIIVLGAGPAGVGAAYRLRLQGKARVTLLEQAPSAGGNSGSFTWRDHICDFGSHRLHPASDAELLRDIGTLLGPDLLDRPRHGRIFLRGRWIHFPLKPVDLLLRLDPAFGMGAFKDMLFRDRTVREDNFANVLRATLGPTICDNFYFPYARKIWGEDPTTLSGIQARKRVAAASFGKLIRKVMNAVPGFKPAGAGRFFYPKQGFGQIAQAYAGKAASLGADVRYGTRVTSLAMPVANGDPWRVRVTRGDVEEELTADHVWSTLPISLVAKFLGDATPQRVRDAAATIRYRAMLLVYVELPVAQFTEFDAHYLPGSDVRITRLSEPKNYAARSEPQGRTVLCAELPTSTTSAEWTMSEEELGQLVCRDLATCGLPVPAAPTAVTVRRLAQAYPIYDQGYEVPFGVLDAWADTLPRFLTYGRQGLFAHDNTHHALAMAYAAERCFEGGVFNERRWSEYRAEFARHVVED